MRKSMRNTMVCLALLGLLNGLIGGLPAPFRLWTAAPAYADGSAADGGLIVTDELGDFSQTYAHSQMNVGAVTADTYARLEQDDTYWISTGSEPEAIYQKKDIRSFLMVVYVEPSAPLPTVQFRQSSDGSVYQTIAAERMDEGTRDGSWRRLVYSAYGLSGADYLSVSWTGSPDVAVSKLRFAYTGGAAFADAGFESAQTAELAQSGGWEAKIAKAAPADAPAFALSVQAAGGAPGQYAQVAENDPSSRGIALLGQRVTVPSFFTGPADLVATLDYRTDAASAGAAGTLKLVALPEAAWNGLASTNAGAGLYNPAAELFSLTLRDAATAPANAAEWTRLTSAGTDLAGALAGYAGQTVVIALFVQPGPDALAAAFAVDNFELNGGELSAGRPHFVNVKQVRDKLFAYRWAQDVLARCQSRYDVWLGRDIELIPDSNYYWEGYFTDPELDVALTYTYKSYDDILAAGRDYDTYYEAAEFLSPGIDPASPADDRIVSLANTSAADMQTITKGWFAKWLQDHADAAQYLSYLHVLTGRSDYAAKAAEIVKELAGKYPWYEPHDVVSPVRDFVTRAFYSPLNEAQYLVAPIAFAVDNLYDSGELADGDKAAVRDDLLYPALEAIKRSARLTNFQVIQDASVGLVGYLYDDAVLIGQAKTGYTATAQSVEALGLFDELLDFGLGEDGFWFEGSPSYHGFVLKFYMFVADAAQRFGSNKGENLYAGNAKLKSMFDAILQMPYPDLTLQANNDSPYKPNLLTPVYLWMMETADREYGVSDSKYRAFLNQAYASVDRGGAELNSLLFGYGRIPPASAPFTLHDANMSGLGTVFTRNTYGGQTYMSTLDYGPFNGGHDHYDKLNLTTYGNGRAWLDDLGISTYKTESADNYYRYSAAHNTVVIPDRNQAGLGGSFVTLGSTRSMHVSAAAADGIFPDVQQYRRAIVSVDDWMLDLFSLKTTKNVTFDWLAHVPNSTLSLDIPTTAQSGSLGTANGYTYLQMESSGATAGNWQAMFADAHDPSLTYRIEMLNSVPTAVYKANSFGTGNEPTNRIPVLAARKSVDGEGDFVALHRFSPGSDGIGGAERTNDGVRIRLTDGSEYTLQYDIAHAAEEAGFKLLKRDAANRVLDLEIVNDNRLTVGHTVYAKSDQVLSGVSIRRAPDGTVEVDNDPADRSPRIMTSLTFYVGADNVGAVTVDGTPTPFVRDGDYVTVEAPLKAKPTLRNGQVVLPAAEDTYAKESEAGRPFGIYTTMGVRNSGTARSNMAAYIKFDLSTYTGEDLSDAKLRFYAYDNAAPYNPVQLSVYGITDNGWSEDTLNWTNAPNLGKSGGYSIVTGIGSTAYPLGTTTMADGNYAWHEIDVSDFVRTAGLNGSKVSFLLFPQTGYNDWIFINSKESGTKGPQLVIKESEDIPAAAGGYVRGGAYAAQHFDGGGALEVMDGTASSDDRIAYAKFDLGSYGASALGKGLLRFRVSEADPEHAVPVSIYGLTDTSWTEAGLTWSSSPNHEANDTTVTGVPATATKVATVYVDRPGTYAVDATAYLQTRLPGGFASFLFADENDGGSLVAIDGAASAEAPLLSLYKPHNETIANSAFIWGGTNAANNYADSTHLIVKNAAGTAADRKSYMQVDLSELRTKRVNRAWLRLYGSNTTSATVAPVTVYGLTDNGWSEQTITFDAAPNHNAATGAVTGTGSTAFALDTVGIGSAGATYGWDVSDFLYEALQSGDGSASFVLAIDAELNDSYIDLNSDDGIRKPVLVVEY